MTQFMRDMIIGVIFFVLLIAAVTAVEGYESDYNLIISDVEILDENLISFSMSNPNSYCFEYLDWNTYSIISNGVSYTNLVSHDNEDHNFILGQLQPSSKRVFNLEAKDLSCGPLQIKIFLSDQSTIAEWEGNPCVNEDSTRISCAGCIDDGICFEENSKIGDNYCQNGQWTPEKPKDIYSMSATDTTVKKINFLDRIFNFLRQ